MVIILFVQFILPSLVVWKEEHTGMLLELSPSFLFLFSFPVLLTTKVIHSPVVLEAKYCVSYHSSLHFILVLYWMLTIHIQQR